MEDDEDEDCIDVSIESKDVEALSNNNVVEEEDKSVLQIYYESAK